MLFTIRMAGYLIAFFANFALGLFIWSKGFDRKVNFYAGLAALFSSMYALLLVILLWKKTLFWMESTWWGTLIIASYVTLILYYRTNTPNKKIIFYFFLFAVIFALLGYTPLITEDLEVHPSYVKSIYGPFEPIGRLYILSGIVYGIYNLIITYKVSNRLKKIQIKYFLIGTLIYALSGILCVSVLPLLKIKAYTEDMPSFFSVFWTGLTIYAIVRYRLMEIDTVIHRTLMWILTLLLVILPIGLVVTFSFDWIASLSRIAKISLTSAVLIFFVWYYSKLKPGVDHFFRRRKYDYYQVLGEIGQKVGSELDINNVVNRLFKELKEVLYIRNGLVLVQLPGQQDYTEAGSIGYDTLLESQKPEKVILTYQSSLSQWLTSHQKALEREQIEVDPQYAPIKQEATAFLNSNAVELLIPVIMENKVNALVGIGKKENLQAYTIRDIELLENMGRQIGITIDNAMHHEDIVEKERLAEELKLGREIQMNLLPREIPRISGLTLQGLMQPAKEIGGDYYDFITLPSAQGEAGEVERLAIVIGDVSGKGVAAGLLMAMAKTAIHTLSQEETSPKQILLRTNTILNQHIGGQKFMTLLYLIWQAQNKTLTYSSAGHEHILIYRANMLQVESIISGGFMLGMIPNIETFLEEKQIKLESKDKILLYTDGVTEAQNQQEDRFGLERLKESFIKHSQKPALELMQAIKDEVYSFIGSHPQYDDITLVVMVAG